MSYWYDPQASLHAVLSSEKQYPTKWWRHPTIHHSKIYMVVVVLVFYGLSTLLRSFRAWLTYPHYSWANLLGSLPVLSAQSLASNWQLPFLNQQRKGENGCRNYFMTNLHERMLLDIRIEPATVRIPDGCGSNRATAPGKFYMVFCWSRWLRHPPAKCKVKLQILIAVVSVKACWWAASLLNNVMLTSCWSAWCLAYKDTCRIWELNMFS